MKSAFQKIAGKTIGWVGLSALFAAAMIYFNPAGIATLAGHGKTSLIKGLATWGQGNAPLLALGGGAATAAGLKMYHSEEPAANPA